MTETRNDEGMVLWCAGLPCVGRDALDAAERQALRRDAMRRLTVGLVCYPLGVLFLVAGIAALAVLPNPALESPLLFGSTAAILFLLTGWLLLVGDDGVRRSKQLRDDLRAGVRLRFAGVLSEPLPEEPTLEMLQACGLLQIGPPQTIDVLPGSKRILRVNGRRPAGWLTAECPATVAQPASARIIAQWLDPVDPYDPEVRGGRRELTEEEKGELRRTLRRAWQRPLPLALLLTAWMVGTVALCRHTGGWPDGLAGGVLLALLSLTLYVDGYVLHCLHRALRLRRDLAQGTVTMISAAEQLTEWLSGSHLPWTINGQPAAWRKQ